MMNSRFSLLGLLLLVLSALPARAGATIAFGSSVGALNLTSNGGILDARFAFEIGCFSPGFVPGRANTSEWLSHWQAFPEGATTYRTTALGAPFPADPRLNSFAGSVRLHDNPTPFTAGVQVYVWGFDRRIAPGKAEWILITDDSWVCPDGTGINPAVSFAVANATEAIVGSINDSGIEMRTAAVALSSTPETLASWQNWHFGTDASIAGLEPTLWGSLADPDHDNRPNLMEYFLGSDPWQGEADPLEGPYSDAGALVLRYRRSLLASDATGGIEWSADLRQWTQSGLTETIIQGDGASALMEGRLAAPPAGAAFFRLKAEE